MEDSGATLAGYGFFTSSWNVHTPDIFTRLSEDWFLFLSPNALGINSSTISNTPLKNTDIHEPVYGTTKLKATTTPQELIKSLESARDLAAALPGHLSTQSRASLEFLNEGRKPLTGVQVRHSAARIYREEQQQDQRKKGNTNQSYSNASRRVPRMTALGVAGLVKAKSGDIASVTQGPITRRVKSVTNPYKNI